MIKEFSVGCSRTINLGNFESLRVEASVTVAIDENKDLHALKGAAQVELRTLLEDTYRAQYGKRMDRMKREPMLTDEGDPASQ